MTMPASGRHRNWHSCWPEPVKKNNNAYLSIIFSLSVYVCMRVCVCLCVGGGASDIMRVCVCLSICRATRSQLSSEKERVCQQVVKSKASMHFIHMQ